MMKRFLFLSLLCGGLSFGAQAQNTVLKVDTNMVTHSSGANRFSAWAEPGSTIWGIQCGQATGAYIAEDFTIPVGTTWAIDSVIVYSYQTFTTPSQTPANPFTGGSVQIFNGSPASGGTLIAGDTATNRYANASFTGIFRVDTISNTTNFARPIFRVAMRGLNNVFSAGTYWVAWSLAGTASVGTGPWANHRVTLVGGTPSYPSGQNAVSKFAGGGSVWGASTDISTPVGFNFMLKGRINPTNSVASTGAATGFGLAKPFPNPTNGTTNLSFSLGAKSRVSLRILNAVGQQMATVVEDELGAGEYTLPFSTVKLAAGVYRVVLQTDKGSDTVPLTVK